MPSSWLDLRDACTAFSHRKPGLWRKHWVDFPSQARGAARSAAASCTARRRSPLTRGRASRGRGVAGRGGGTARRARPVRGRGEEGGHQEEREDHDDPGDRAHGQPRVGPRGRGHRGDQGNRPARRRRGAWRGGRARSTRGWGWCRGRQRPNSDGGARGSTDLGVMGGAGTRRAGGRRGRGRGSRGRGGRRRACRRRGRRNEADDEAVAAARAVRADRASGRAAGSLASSDSIRSRSGPACTGGSWRLVRMAAMTAVMVDPANGGLPSVAWYRVAPRAHRSAGGPTEPSSSCSGAR